MGERCENCRWFWMHGSGEPSGWCKRFPPVLIQKEAKSYLTMMQENFARPVVQRLDTCGEFKPQDKTDGD